MKRSDAINKLDDELLTYFNYNEIPFGIADNIMKFMEKDIGMLPPYNPHSLDHGSITDCEWTPELEMIDEDFQKLTTEQNITQAKAEVASWPQWKIDNIKAVFSEGKDE